MESEVLMEIQEVVDKYEKSRKKLKLWGLIIGIPLLIISIYILVKNHSQEITIRLSSIWFVIISFSTSVISMGSRAHYKYIEKVKTIVDYHKTIKDNLSN